MAVQELFPGTQVTIGPVIENGFYYDFARKEPFTEDDLTKIERAIFIISTWGEGDPPLDAEDFYKDLQEFDQNLYNLRYGIMGLGDRSYSIFNGFARDLDNSLGKLGATRLGERVEADLDYDDDDEDFIKKMGIILT